MCRKTFKSLFDIGNRKHNNFENVIPVYTLFHICHQNANSNNQLWLSTSFIQSMTSSLQRWNCAFNVRRCHTTCWCNGMYAWQIPFDVPFDVQTVQSLRRVGKKLPPMWHFDVSPRCPNLLNPFQYFLSFTTRHLHSGVKVVKALERIPAQSIPLSWGNTSALRTWQLTELAFNWWGSRTVKLLETIKKANKGWAGIHLRNRCYLLRKRRTSTGGSDKKVRGKSQKKQNVYFSEELLLRSHE